ncbi:MAG: 6-phospho-3-hexuloisomerase [Candidatus Bathyarchaeia archaeon]
MRYLDAAVEEIIAGVREAIDSLDEDQVYEMLKVLQESHGRKIMVVGVGRSGLIGRAFAMRLMHLGFHVYVVGETITPAMEKDDLLIAISGSGTTTFSVAAAEMAKRVGARVIAITSYPVSALGKLSDVVVMIRGRTKLARTDDYFSRQILGVHEPLAPLGTLFEQSAMVFLDGVVAELMRRMGKSEGEMRRRHATIE